MLVSEIFPKNTLEISGFWSDFASGVNLSGICSDLLNEWNCGGMILLNVGVRWSCYAPVRVMTSHNRIAFRQSSLEQNSRIFRQNSLTIRRNTRICTNAEIKWEKLAKSARQRGFARIFSPEIVSRKLFISCLKSIVYFLPLLRCCVIFRRFFPCQPCSYWNWCFVVFFRIRRQQCSDAEQQAGMASRLAGSNSAKMCEEMCEFLRTISHAR